MNIAVKHFECSDLAAFEENDTLLPLLSEAGAGSVAGLSCHQWLMDTPAKRMMFQYIYGDLLRGGGKKVLDVGGGVTGLTARLAKNNDYTLVDLLAHDEQATAVKQLTESGATFFQQDWFDLDLDADYDVIVANDLFPNVDQRLELFLDRMLDRGKELRILVTYYNNHRFYSVKRTDADELMFLQAWSGRNLVSMIQDRSGTLSDSQVEGFTGARESMFANGRNVSLVTVSRFPAGT